MRVVIVIPTYNEAENIGRLVEKLDSVFKKIPQHEFEILVVDGNSPDGTADVVTRTSQKYPYTHLLLEKVKSGLGGAYVYGFRYAMEHMNPDVLMEMDADFQHDPESVPEMIKPLEEGYDYVIGSRFIKGGSIPKEWAFYRKLLSIGGNWFSKIVLGIFDVDDFTSGFKASRVRGFVDKLDLDAVGSAGFAYKIDLLHKIHRLGAKIKEVPIQFGLRDRGDSKMEKNNMADSMRVVISLRFNESKSFLKFSVVGFIGFFVDSGAFNLLRVVLSGVYSSLASGILGMVTTFILNNSWSFGDRKIEGGGRKAKSFVMYACISYVPILARSKLIDFAVLRFGDTFLVSNIAFLIGILVGLVWNFTIYSKLIWNKD